MTQPPSGDKPTLSAKEIRLAEALRQNLRRRKTAARAVAQAPPSPHDPKQSAAQTPLTEAHDPLVEG